LGESKNTDQEDKVDSFPKRRRWATPYAVFLILVLLVGVVAVGSLLTSPHPQPKYFSDACLVEVPENSTIQIYLGLFSGGNTVTYTNGSQVAYALGSCPQPVKPSIYAIVTMVEGDPRFIALENGSQYSLDPQSYGGHLGMKDGKEVIFKSLTFVLFSKYPVHPCGLGNGTSNELIGEIAVEFVLGYDGVTVSDFAFSSASGPFPQESSICNGIGVGNESNPGGLILTASLNTTVLKQGEGIGVNAGLFNERSGNITLIPDYNTFSNITGWGTYSSNTCANGGPLGIAVFEGHYVLDNVTTAGAPLQLAEPYPIPCAVYVPETRYVLLPNSSTAEVSWDSGLSGFPATSVQELTFTLGPFGGMPTNPVPGQTWSAGAGDGASGYWTGSWGSTTFSTFPVGAYTVVVADLWGQVRFVYFSVV
jgi:hypothetical protein